MENLKSPPDSIFDGCRDRKSGGYESDKPCFKKRATGRAPHKMVIARSDNLILPGDLFGANQKELSIQLSVANFGEGFIAQYGGMTSTFVSV